MSEEGDLLSQWRAYADNGAGISIGFSKEYFETLGNLKRDRNDEFNASLSKVEYEVPRQKELISKHADGIIALVLKGAMRTPTLLEMATEAEAEQRKAKFRRMLFQFIFFFFYLYSVKNPAFSEEREWRLISHVLRNSKNGEIGQLSRMDFRALTDRIIPFRRIPLEKLGQQAITEVIIGPRNVTPEVIMTPLLEKHGWTDVTVRRSKASYR
jgi:Protein of unknown function (DUF2971)